ncbi:O-methyltransferase [Williamsia deligens]|uniref:Methyltransferase domain-containing protein n=1 Tax=Williamsia deligens TaxID=321325 RepID=A0ABW3G235_9NOCA|nr:hypothetical protein [Williamsia deligens]MCP2194506.1 putative O-methyltransferase YrrM [Williamsia deligens]
MSRTQQRVDRVYEALATRISPSWAAAIDERRPHLGAAWGGPLNGQHHRREIVREIARTVHCDRVLETGTFRGTSTEFFSNVFGVPVDTVEVNPRYFHYSRRRLAVTPSITVTLGDSRQFLRTVARTSAPDDTVFVYLDAHWLDDLPLAEELAIIDSEWTRAVVLIDDFEVPGDPGYAFDDYGGDKVLTAANLPASVDDWSLFYPSLPSHAETGARRGCCLLTSPAIATPDWKTLTAAGQVAVSRRSS